MKIKRLEIKGFKSIEHLVLEDVPSLMVLAGSNGAGKSNLVDALRFFSMAISQTVGEAASEFGGWQNIQNWNHLSKELFFKIDVLDSLNKHFFYEINIEFITNKYIITHEVLKNTLDKEPIFDRKPQPSQANSSVDNNLGIGFLGMLIGGAIGALVSRNEKTGEGFVNGALVGGLLTGTGIKEEQNANFKSDLTLFKTLFSQSEFYQFISNMQIFRIDPRLAKQNYHSLTDNQQLLLDGRNIADVLAKYEQDREFNEELLEWLEMIVPNLKTVKAEKRDLDNSTYLRFQENSCNKPFPAGLISDGTIYTLCILTAVLSRSSQYGITIIEEPERGIHPQAIGELISLMREKTQGKHNIILTTHSESVVRNLELEELYLVRKENGQTLIKDVKDSGVDKNQLPLDEAWLTNSFDGGLPW